MFAWLKDKFKKKQPKPLYYRMYISLSTDENITIAADVQEDEEACRAFTMFIYNGLKEPLQQQFIKFLETNKEIPAFQNVLTKLEFLKTTEQAMKERSMPCIRPLDVFKVIGG